MPTTRRRRTRSPVLRDYASIGLGERLRWHGGGPIIRDFTPINDAETTSRVTIWPSWAAFAEVYGRCRSAFLVNIRVRFPNASPAAERLYLAYQRAGDAGADAEAATIAEERREDVRRVYAAVVW